MEVGHQVVDPIHRLRIAGAATIRLELVSRLAPARRLPIAIAARHLADQLRHTAAALPRMVAARRLIGRDRLMEEGLHRTALALLSVGGHRPIDQHPLTEEVLRLIGPHRPPVAPIVVAVAAPLSLTVAGVGVDLEAGIAAVVDVLPPGDTEAIANQFLKQIKAPLTNTSGAYICT